MAARRCSVGSPLASGRSRRAMCTTRVRGTFGMATMGAGLIGSAFIVKHAFPKIGRRPGAARESAGGPAASRARFSALLDERARYVAHHTGLARVFPAGWPHALVDPLPAALAEVLLR